MGNVTQKIEQIMRDEQLSLRECMEKYPHLKELQMNELYDEYQGNYSRQTEQLQEVHSKKELLKG